VELFLPLIGVNDFDLWFLFGDLTVFTGWGVIGSNDFFFELSRTLKVLKLLG